jgi:Ca2+-binding RTX toxin-like protein
VGPLGLLSQGVLTHRESSVRGTHGYAPLRHPSRMPRRAAVLVLVVLLAFPAAVVAASRQATPGPDNLVGTAGDDTINGRAGKDTIRGRSGDDHLNGGVGNDTISGDSGNDVIIGGRGDDLLLGGAGNDRISGGPGADVVAGGSGRDVIRVRDGAVDQVTCGAARDRVIADPQDEVARNCEVVQRG